MIGGAGRRPGLAARANPAVRERTDRPFGVGFISSAPGDGRLDGGPLEERVAGHRPLLRRPDAVRRRGPCGGHESLRSGADRGAGAVAARAGVDVIAAQGTRSRRAHREHSGTLPLIPAVVDVAGGIPVVAAGGIGDGRGLAAVLLLGAEGAWIGTRFVASREAASADWAKAAHRRGRDRRNGATRAYDLASEAPFPPDIVERVVRNDVHRGVARA